MRWFFAYSIMYMNGDLGSDFFGGFWSKIRRDRLSFMSMSIGFTAKYSWRIHLIRLNAFRVFPVQAKILFGDEFV